MRTLRLSLFVLFCGGLASSTSGADIARQIDQIKAVGKEGAGNAEAAVAWKALVNTGIDALLPTLSAMDQADQVAANWLRLAAEAMVEKERQASRPPPVEKLEAFLADAAHAPAGRRLAYEFIVEADPTAPGRLLPRMVEDASVELRRDAIEAAIDKATPSIKSDPEKAAALFRRLFDASRDKAQAEKIAKILKALKVDTDLNKHFGVIPSWMLIGPFDSDGGSGFAKAYDVETKVDLKAACMGKDGAPLKWVPHSSAEPYGAVDLNKALGKFKDAAIYAFTTVESDKQLPVEIRAGSLTAIKVFLNGKEVLAHEEYHHGTRFDQFIARSVLKPGRNELLVKVCQNNQTENWAQDWKFQLRLCDSTGGALPITVPAPDLTR